MAAEMIRHKLHFQITIHVARTMIYEVYQFIIAYVRVSITHLAKPFLTRKKEPFIHNLHASHTYSMPCIRHPNPESRRKPKPQKTYRNKRVRRTSILPIQRERKTNDAL
jgi:hypothetical protein